MRFQTTCTILAIALGLTAGCSSAPKGPTPEEMIAAASAVDKTFLDAFNRGDVATMSSLYWNSPEVALFPPDLLQARGVGAIKAAHEKMIAGMPGAKLEVTESHNIPVGDVVIGWGLWKVTVPSPGGPSSEMTGRYTDVKAERDGKWVYLVDHASVPLPPAAPAAAPAAK